MREAEDGLSLGRRAAPALGTVPECVEHKDPEDDVQTHMQTQTHPHRGYIQTSMHAYVQKKKEKPAQTGNQPKDAPTHELLSVCEARLCDCPVHVSSAKQTGSKHMGKSFLSLSIYRYIYYPLRFSALCCRYIRVAVPHSQHSV